MLRSALMAMVLLPSIVPACITLPGAGKAPVTIASETAVVSWDPQTKLERFIRTAEFRNDGGPIGFLVPTPTPPKLTPYESHEHNTLKAELEGIVAPRFEDRKRAVYRLSDGWDILPPGTMASKSLKQLATGAILYMGDRDDVMVLGQSRVGNYDTAVLKAKDPSALLRWLGKHGFESSTRLTEWLRPYTEKGWAITAFRFAPKSKSFTSEPVELAFQADRPFYPYREPHMENAPTGRKLRVFVVTPGKVVGQLQDGPWSTKPEFSGPLPSRGNYLIAPLLGLPNDVVGNYWVTSFLDRTRVRPESELFFAKAGDATPVEPPPVTRWVDDPVYIPKGGLALSVAAVCLLSAAVLNRRKRPTRALA